MLLLRARACLAFFLTIPCLITSGPVAGPEISPTPHKPLNSLNVQQPLVQHQQQYQQQQQPKLNNNLQEAQLNSLNAYASNYEMISDKQNQNDKFKASYKLPEMERNFTPIQNSNSIAPEFASTLATHAPVLMQYLPQTINEGGIQYLQLIPTRPLVVPLGSYMAGNNALPSLAYQQQLTPNSAIDYAARPLLSAVPVNMPPPAAATPLMDMAGSPMPAYGLQSAYAAGSLNPYKQNHRTNREAKDKPVLGPISLNMNEYLSQGHNQPQVGPFRSQGRP